MRALLGPLPIHPYHPPLLTPQLTPSRPTEKLRKHFMLFGEVIDAVVMKDPISRRWVKRAGDSDRSRNWSGRRTCSTRFNLTKTEPLPFPHRSRGFGFITFADAAAVDRVLSQDNHILDSRRVEAKRAVPRSETLLKQQQEPLLMQPPTPPTRPLPASALMAGMAGLQQHMHGGGGGGMGLQGIIPQQSSSAAAAAAAAALMGGGAHGLSAGPPPLPLPPPYHQMGAPSPHGGLGGHGGGLGGVGGLSSTHKIFVGGLHYETKDAEFRAYFERFGHVVSAEVRRVLGRGGGGAGLPSIRYMKQPIDRLTLTHPHTNPIVSFCFGAGDVQPGDAQVARLRLRGVRGRGGGGARAAAAAARH